MAKVAEPREGDGVHLALLPCHWSFHFFSFNTKYDRQFGTQVQFILAERRIFNDIILCLYNDDIECYFFGVGLNAKKADLCDVNYISMLSDTKLYIIYTFEFDEEKYYEHFIQTYLLSVE